MKKTTLLAAAFLTTVSSVALAQAQSSPSTATPTATTKAQTSEASLQQQVTTDLQNSGFTNVKVMPESFLVQATDKAGNAVTMFIGPHSMSEVTTVGANNGQATGINTGGSERDTGGMFTSCLLYTSTDEPVGLNEQFCFQRRRVPDAISDEMMQLVIVARRQPRRHWLDALAIARPNES